MPPKSAVASKLQYVSVRKATFTEGVRVGNAKLLKYWPHDTPAPEDMAELGFLLHADSHAGGPGDVFLVREEGEGLARGRVAQQHAL
ncbi:hypothetical protein HF325_005594 [Metschnikowia pulcherrima]|uniref:Uncharacterized protein n=1 Tax=Metschnikowia pulcherrima TaxID=27326 RepID=A0A8H7L9V8_9ASCO|nr:hypothetical protein HF325_005594 [Metschnikowia pulcherrima]